MGLTKAQKRKRHIELSWWIIERKLMYYHPEKVAVEHHKKLTVSDQEFDDTSNEYLKLCLDLNLPNTVCHSWGMSIDCPELQELSKKAMQEVDFSRPSVQLVLRKYGVRND